MSIKSLMIPCVEIEYSQEYIANVFWRQGIAQVSNITLIPYLKNTEIYNFAYITIQEWCDSESAYNFIYRISSTNKEARLVHNDDDWWPVQLNTHNNGDINVGVYTVSFDSSYFIKEPVSWINEYEEWCLEDELVNSQIEYAIQNSKNVTLRPTPPKLRRQVACDYEDWCLDDELTNLRIDYAIQNSENVTLRPNPPRHLIREVSADYL